LYERQGDPGIVAGLVIDAVGGLDVVGWFGKEDVVYVGLGITVVEGESTGLDLDHDAMAAEEDVVRIG
jgi:hypothetical protein